MPVLLSHSQPTRRDRGRQTTNTGLTSFFPEQSSRNTNRDSTIVQSEFEDMYHSHPNASITDLIIQTCPPASFSEPADSRTPYRRQHAWLEEHGIHSGHETRSQKLVRKIRHFPRGFYEGFRELLCIPLPTIKTDIGSGVMGCQQVEVKQRRARRLVKVPRADVPSGAQEGWF